MRTAELEFLAAPQSRTLCNFGVVCLNAPEGHLVLDEDVARLSPFVHEHINLLGRYSFAVPEEVIRGELRSLRNPNDPDA